jgi:two-component system OmpR family sensor kinase
LAATPVEVVVDSTRNEVKVLNEGPIVAAAELRSLKERFDRGTAAGKSHNASGFGLGLAIADTIASQAGISLTLLSPAHGRKDGFQVTLSSSGP